MKLYTEEEIRRTFGCGLNEIEFKGFMKAITPIELPTDEEMKHKIIKEVFVSWFSNDEYERGFQDGAKWVIEQIKKQK